VYTGILDKANIILKLVSKYNLKLEQIAYIGDNINSVEVMKLVGLSEAVSDALDSVKNISDIVLKSKVGSGAFREFVDYLISQKKI
jgi:YrbI family 3-deoxy-D-manno-octulosonate 8-phosphate phosphatase